MTTTSDKIRIEVELETTDALREAKKLKTGLDDIGSAAGSVSTATGTTVVAFEDLESSMNALIGLNFAEAFGKPVYDAISNIGKSITDATKCMREFNQKKVEALKADRVNVSNDGKIKIKELTNIQLAVNRIKQLNQEFTKCAKQGVKNLKAELDELKIKMASVGKAAKLLAVALVPIAGIAASFSSSALGKEIYNTANRVGMSTAKFQQWKYILEQTGADITDLTGAQQTLTEAQLDVAEGAEDIIDAFKRIGLSSEEILKMDREELFEKTIAGLQNIENSTERAAVAYRLLSEDGSTLASLLAMSNEETRQLADNYAQMGAIMSESLINKSLKFQSSLSSLRTAVRGIANTLAEIFLPALTAVANAITWVITKVNILLRLLFGLELTTSSSGVDNAVGGGIGSSFGTMADNIDEAEKSAQKLRRTLMGFDELNVVDDLSSSGSGSSGGSSGGAGGGLTDFGDGLLNNGIFNSDEWSAKVGKLKGIMENVVPIALIFIGHLGAAWCLLTGNWVGFLAFATMAGIGYASADSNGLWERLSQKFSDLHLKIVPVATLIIGALGTVACLFTGNIVGAAAFAAMAGISIGIISGGEGWSGFLSYFEGLLPEVKKYALPIIGLLAGMICLFMGNWPGAAILLTAAGVSGIVSYFTGQGVFGNLIDIVKEAGNSVISYFKNHLEKYFTLDYWKNLFGVLGTAMSNALGQLRTNVMNGWNNIKDYFKTNIGPIFTAAYWSNKFDPIRSGLQTKIGEARTAVMNGWNNVKDYYNTNIGPKFTVSYWSSKFDPIRSGLSNKLGEARTTVINTWNTIKDYYTKNIAPKFTASFWSTKFNTVKEGARTAFNGLIAIIEKAINNIVNKLNTVKFSIPSWVPQVGGKSFGISLKTVSIPRLATGGIATASTLANIGENGREAVLPLDHNTEWMDALADKIAGRNQTPTKLVLKVGEKELGWATINGINQITKQTGELQLVL